MINERLYRFCLTTLIIQLLTIRVSSQEETDGSFGHCFLFNVNTTEKNTMVRQPVYFPVSDTAVDQIFDRLSDRYSTNLHATTPFSAAILGVKLHPELKRFYSATMASISKNYYSFLIGDSSEATLIAMGINSSNYRDFRYHVVENDSIELVRWSAISDLRKEYGAKDPFAFIGRFRSPGKWIMIEVYNINNYATREGVIFDWRTDLRPQLEQVIAEITGDYFNILYPAVNHGYATRFNKVTKAPEDMRIPNDSIRSISFQLKKQGTLARSAHLITTINGASDTIKLGLVDADGYFTLDAAAIRLPGKYELVFQRQAKTPTWEESQLLRIPFEVTDSSFGKSVAKQVFIFISITIVALLLSFWIYRRTINKQLRKLAQQRETAQLKLQSIKSQLNPHFIFNALSSIQNLMNKHAVQRANYYLSRFASLTRATLESSAQDTVSLDQEWIMTEHYLEMEQLRFGFHFELKMAPHLKSASIEIPPMLLQPLIENAVKHGVAGKKDGQIIISAGSSNNDLRLTVEDNGDGFDAAAPVAGFGLRLSRERLELLNKLHSDKPYQMSITTSGTGTMINITFKNWLS